MKKLSLILSAVALPLVVASSTINSDGFSQTTASTIKSQREIKIGEDFYSAGRLRLTAAAYQDSLSKQRVSEADFLKKQSYEDEAARKINIIKAGELQKEAADIKLASFSNYSHASDNFAQSGSYFKDSFGLERKLDSNKNYDLAAQKAISALEEASKLYEVSAETFKEFSYEQTSKIIQCYEKAALCKEISAKVR